MRQVIVFYADDNVQMPRLRQGVVERWLKAVAQSHGGHVGELCYQFCDDDAILEANRKYLDHDYYTDIITFDRTRANRYSADLLISLDTVRSNADLLGQDWSVELHRVMVHGLLHLTGLGDKTDEEATLMRQAEDDALALLNQYIPEGETLLLPEEALQ